MLFVLDSSLDDAIPDPSHPDHDSVCVELERLAHSRWRRKLVIFAESRHLAGLIAASNRFSGKTKAVFAHVHHARTFKRELLRRMELRVRLTALQNRSSVVEAGGVTELVIPISSVPHGLFDLSVVLAENMNDAKCYLILGRLAIASSEYGLPRVSLAGELRGGGGSAIEAEYLQIKDAGERLVLCILDSDIRFPTCEPSPWRGRIIQDDADRPSAIAMSFVIGVYSVENLLPIDAFFAVTSYVSDAARQYAITQDAAHWRSHAPKEHWPFLPLKKGVTCRALRGEGVGGEFWRAQADHFDGYSSKNCAKQVGACGSTCLKFPKYPSDFLAEFVLEYERASEKSLAGIGPSIPRIVRPSFAELARRIVAWCCVGGSIGVAGAG